MRQTKNSVRDAGSRNLLVKAFGNTAQFPEEQPFFSRFPWSDLRLLFELISIPQASSLPEFSTACFGTDSLCRTLCKQCPSVSILQGSIFCDTGYYCMHDTHILHAANIYENRSFYTIETVPNAPKKFQKFLLVRGRIVHIAMLIEAIRRGILSMKMNTRNVQSSHICWKHVQGA